MSSKIKLILLAMVVLFACALVAQNVTGSIAGTVLDPSGAAVANTSVVVRNTDRNEDIRKIKTDGRGNYSATLLPEGHYAVTVEAPGFKKFEAKNININANDKVTVNGNMQVGATSEQVTVESTAAQVQTQTQTSSRTVTGT